MPAFSWLLCYKATQYRSVAVERLQQVAGALRLRVREVFTLEQV
jgi:hypothetical protein